MAPHDLERIKLAGTRTEYAVVDQETGHRVGVIAQTHVGTSAIAETRTMPPWQVVNAGDGTPGTGERFDTSAEAIEALLILRGTSEGTGPLAIDPSTGLRRVDMAILDFEGASARISRGTGSKHAEIHAKFGMSATYYYAVLNRLLDNPEARRYAPLTVKRLLRLRDRRRIARTPRERRP